MKASLPNVRKLYTVNAAAYSATIASRMHLFFRVKAR